MTVRAWFVACASVVVLFGAGEASHAQVEELTPVTDAVLQDPDPADWLSWRRTLDGWGYSPLDEIDRGNVGELRLAWSWGMEPGVSQTTPMVHDGILYLANPGNVVQALHADSGDFIWEYRREMEEARRPAAQMRSLAIYEDLIILNTVDAHVVGLDARTGDVRWETPVIPEEDGYGFSSGPVIANGVIVAGLRGCERFREDTCYIVGLDARTGQLLWRTSTIARPGERGGDTWGDLPLLFRAGSDAWIPGSYDPGTGLVFYGTAQAKPWSRDARGTDGDALYSNSTLALDPATGEMAWYFQHRPRDNWDRDHPFERILVETELAPDPAAVPWISPRVRPGELRKVVTGIPGKTGIVWTLDAATGEFLWARPTIHQNIITDIDLDTGRPAINEDSAPTSLDEPSFACPHLLGGKDQPSGVYSPDTGALYMPLNNTCVDLAMSVERAEVSDGYGLSIRVRHVPDVDPDTAPVGRLEAVSASTGRTLWRYEQRAPIYGSLLATAGNLVFSGDVVRRFRAFDAASGDVRWETILNGPVSGRPMTYSVGGRQYLAITAGGVTQASMLLRLTPELTTTTGSNTVFVFALP